MRANRPVADPMDENITHINVYSDSVTMLGRVLSNFAHTPIVHPEHGKFESLEGYWYWLSTGMQHDELRKAVGFAAKKLGRTFKTVHRDDFQALFEKALALKMEQHPVIADVLKKCQLPLLHYYYFGAKNNNPRIIEPKGHEWVVEWLERFRTQGRAP